jgi:hypothetical protein
LRFPSAASSCRFRCVRAAQLSSPRLALYSLTESARAPFHAEPTHELIRVALEADVQVYTIVFDNPSAMGYGNTIPFRPSLVAKPWDQARQRQGPQMLAELSAKTGGLNFLAQGG